MDTKSPNGCTVTVVGSDGVWCGGGGSALGQVSYFISLTPPLTESDKALLSALNAPAQDNSYGLRVSK